MKYLPTIGLEIHAELRTNTKMFCSCLNNSDEKEPNKNTCPICLGHPGVLPTINKKAVESIIKIGLAVKGEINRQFKFDRKNYFYPDLSKGYQISQYDMPIVKNGGVDVSARVNEPKVISLNRVHLEEDAGKLVHSTSFADTARLPAGRQGLNVDNAENNSQRNSASSLRESATLVDFNRGGVPLMELVTEPVIHSATEAVAFAKELQLILRYLGVADADMEKGQMRVDANVSLSETADIRGLNADHAENNQNSQRGPLLSAKSALGTKTEIKNLNSFRAIEEAINYEIKRQAEILDSGEKIKQETRGWDDMKQKTIGQRSKEEAHDYRYFPEPDLPLLDQSGFNITALKSEIPELPQEKRLRFKEQFKLLDEQVNILVENEKEAEYFEEAVSELEADANAEITNKKTQLLFNYLNSDLKGLIRERELNLLSETSSGFWAGKITAENLADLVEMVAKNEINSRVAKDLLVKMADSGVDPRTIVESEELGQISGEEALQKVVSDILKNNPVAIADYKKGKTNALQFLVGKAMAQLKGRGNPEILKSLFDKELKQ